MAPTLTDNEKGLLVDIALCLKGKLDIDYEKLAERRFKNAASARACTKPLRDKLAAMNEPDTASVGAAATNAGVTKTKAKPKTPKTTTPKGKGKGKADAPSTPASKNRKIKAEVEDENMGDGDDGYETGGVETPSLQIKNEVDHSMGTYMETFVGAENFE